MGVNRKYKILAVNCDITAAQSVDEVNALVQRLSPRGTLRMQYWTMMDVFRWLRLKQHRLFTYYKLFQVQFLVKFCRSCKDNVARIVCSS